jgi:hypothetical protein
MPTTTAAHLSAQSTPVCAHCGGRIRLLDCLWKELDAGTVRASYALDFADGRRRPRRVWHPGCLPSNTRQLPG